jgi:hypothetical protein
MAETGAGTGTATVADTDAAMDGETGRTDTYGLRATETNNEVRGRANFTFAEAGPSDQDLTEWALFDGSGRMLCRIVTDALPKSSEQEVRADITLTISGSAQTGGAFTDDGEAALADAIQLPSETVGLDEIAWGEGTADPTESDTSLGNEVHRKVAERTTDLESIEVSAPQFESEPSSQPHDYTEVGVFDNTGRMVYRVTFNPYDKDDSIRFTTRVGFRIV